jgi:predicted DNA-binding transcriptional regulator AlpA
MTFLTFPELKSAGVGYSRVHIDRLEKAGEFPKRVHLGANRVAWLADEIQAHMARAVTARSVA